MATDEPVLDFGGNPEWYGILGFNVPLDTV